MTKKTKISIAIGIGIIIFLLIGAFFLLAFMERNNQDQPSWVRTLTPFGYENTGTTDGGINTTIIPNTATTTEEEVTIPNLRKITSLPVAGATIFQDEEGSTTVRWVDRATGHIFETKEDTLINTELSTANIPKIYNAVWLSSDSLVMEYTDPKNPDIPILYGAILRETNPDSTTTPKSYNLNGSFIPADSVFISPNSTQDKLFYFKNTSGGVEGYTTSVLSNDQKKVFTSPFGEWIPQWTTTNTIALTTKASGQAPGYIYFFNIQTGHMERILGPIKGLTTLVSHNGKDVFYSQNTDSGITSLNDFNIDTNTSSELSVNTLPEKCVETIQENTLYCAVPDILQNAIYPDDWYKGKLSFKDSLWGINRKTNSTFMIEDVSKTAHQSLDIVDLTLSKNAQYLIFINKNDGALWSYRLY